MRFSKEAERYLDKLNRDSRFVITDRLAVIEYLTKQHITPFPAIVDFQMDFSGLELTVSKNRGATFYTRLFPANSVARNMEIEQVVVDGQTYFFCGDHETAQFYFVVGQHGQMCTYDNSTVNIISSSFEKFIENYAMQDLLSRQKRYEHPYFYNLKKVEAFDTLTKDYSRDLMANDDYNTWLSSYDITVVKGTWYDRAAQYIHIYGDNKRTCEAFADTLKAAGIIT
jgi:hypothetical protein